MIRLNNLQPGEKGTISHLEGEHPTVQRLMAMALIPGAGIEMLRVAPLGDPIAIRLQHSQISLRKEDATCVVLQDAH